MASAKCLRMAQQLWLLHLPQALCPGFLWTPLLTRELVLAEMASRAIAFFEGLGEPTEHSRKLRSIRVPQPPFEDKTNVTPG